MVVGAKAGERPAPAWKRSRRIPARMRVKTEKEKEREKKKRRRKNSVARYRKFESSHRGSGCCFVMRRTHLSNLHGLVGICFSSELCIRPCASANVAVCKTATREWERDASERREKERESGLSSFCQDSRDYRSKTRQLIRISPPLPLPLLR